MRIDDVWLRYGRRGPWVLREVTLALPTGATAVLLGRNGAGKSTLLRAIVGTLVPARGRIGGRPATIAWVPERFPADQPFTVIDYLTFMGTVRGMPAAAAATAARDWAGRFDLTSYLDVRLPSLSKGTAQKVGLTQALLTRPGLLVLDEPTEGLDAAVLAQLPLVIAEVTAAGGSVVVSDHSGKLVDLPGARRWSVADGRVTADDPTPAEEARCVIEVAVSASRAEATVAQLRAAGHDVLGVRRERADESGVRPEQVGERGAR
ncbi:ATP-binding cassette domain-containing protein [Planosporangium sp. 12N6]|uniref:ATP-binding cassette domain-containing protein n=1 Tax=Planosporangium spinosum TaxID=3402278 RepID=UPI003CE74CE4